MKIRTIIFYLKACSFAICCLQMPLVVLPNWLQICSFYLILLFFICPRFNLSKCRWVIVSQSQQCWQLGLDIFFEMGTVLCALKVFIDTWVYCLKSASFPLIQLQWSEISSDFAKRSKVITSLLWGIWSWYCLWLYLLHCNGRTARSE